MRGPGRYRRPPGLSLTELMVVVGILVLLLGLVTIAGRRGLAMRELDRAAREIHGALSLAHSIARNTAGGATVEFTLPTADAAGGWTVKAGGTVHRQEEIPRGVEIAPASLSSVEFAQNGAVANQLSITVSSRLTGASRSITVHAGTGAVVLED